MVRTPVCSLTTAPTKSHTTWARTLKLGRLTAVWLEEPSPAAERHQTLFKHLCRGNNIRGADVPIRLTRPMARHFLQAPDHLSVEEALRWAQVRGLGGDKGFAGEVLASRLGTNFG
jgi:hypothetical protein